MHLTLVCFVAFIEGYVDRNSFFCRLELPDGIMPLCVKVKPEQNVRLFLEPILSRQGLPSDHVMVHLVSTFLFWLRAVLPSPLSRSSARCSEIKQGVAWDDHDCGKSGRVRTSPPPDFMRPVFSSRLLLFFTTDEVKNDFLSEWLLFLVSSSWLPLLLPWRALDTMTVNAMITRKLQNVWSKGVDDSYYKFVSRFFKHCILLSYLVHCIGVFVLAFSSLSPFQ